MQNGLLDYTICIANQRRLKNMMNFIKHTFNFNTEPQIFNILGKRLKNFSPLLHHHDFSGFVDAAA